MKPDLKWIPTFKDSGAHTLDHLHRFRLSHSGYGHLVTDRPVDPHSCPSQSLTIWMAGYRWWTHKWPLPGEIVRQRPIVDWILSAAHLAASQAFMAALDPLSRIIVQKDPASPLKNQITAVIRSAQSAQLPLYIDWESWQDDAVFYLLSRSEQLQVHGVPADHLDTFVHVAGMLNRLVLLTDFSATFPRIIAPLPDFSTGPTAAQ
ncbi:MAG: hypothetical protein OWS74_01755 [Firmicutes bacterium]|nr:hypothetical protein [Bacillota bacterium]